MSDEPSPRPWRCSRGPTVNAVVAANGAVVVPHTGYAANARLIVDAVNEHDKLKAERDLLRDIVRRLVRVAQDTLEFAEAMSGIVPDNPERAKARSEITSLLREARAAIGEDKHGHT